MRYQLSPEIDVKFRKKISKTGKKKGPPKKKTKKKKNKENSRGKKLKSDKKIVHIFGISTLFFFKKENEKKVSTSFFSFLGLG